MTKYKIYNKVFELINLVKYFTAGIKLSNSYES